MYIKYYISSFKVNLQCKALPDTRELPSISVNGIKLQKPKHNNKYIVKDKSKKPNEDGFIY